MKHLIYQANSYYFNKRVPFNLREYIAKKLIRFSLKTDSEKLAIKLAAIENAKLEIYWDALLKTGLKHSHENYKAVIERAGLYGFYYQKSKNVAKLPLNEVVDRLLHVGENFTTKTAEAVLGGVEQPVIMLTDVLPHFWELSNDIVLTKSENQIRKWKNPRILAMHHFIVCIGDKPLANLDRDDFLKYKDWWIQRILNEEVVPGTANKHLIYIKTMIRRVCEHFKIKIDATHLFARLAFDDGYEPRPPFSTEYIRDTLLNEKNLAGMNEINKSLLHVFAETGVLFSEQTSILPENIILNHAIPHIIIEPQVKKKLKTKYRKRVIPLTGYAYDVFLKYPNGFSEYQDRSDSLTTTAGKFLRENNLLPSEKHSVYSLRHSFQDRLLAAKTLDRIQADLMGHKFQRPTYGSGATLEDKLEAMKKIQIKI
jgi:site-specific recombinase XerD